MSLKNDDLFQDMFQSAHKWVSLHYLLENKKIIPIDCDFQTELGQKNLIYWAEEFEKSIKNNTRHVAETTIGDLWISTVFLGIDHSFSFGGPPVLFETMIFQEQYASYDGLYHFSDLNSDRYCFYEQAEEGHRQMVRWAKKNYYLRATLAWVLFWGLLILGLSLLHLKGHP